MDAWADERLTYETDNVRRTLVELAKFYFGTEFQSKMLKEEKARCLMREDEITPACRLSQMPTRIFPLTRSAWKHMVRTIMHSLEWPKLRTSVPKIHGTRI